MFNPLSIPQLSNINKHVWYQFYHLDLPYKYYKWRNSNVVLHYLHTGCLPPNMSHGDLFGWKVTKFTQHTWKTKAPAAWWKYEEHHSGGQVIHENDTGFYNINKHICWNHLEPNNDKLWQTYIFVGYVTLRFSLLNAWTVCWISDWKGVSMSRLGREIMALLASKSQPKLC